MRGLALLALLVSALVGVATSAGAARRHHAPAATCLPGHSHVVVADAQAQIYKAPNSRGNLTTVDGCAYGHGRSYLLGGVPDCESAIGCKGVEHETLAGPIVAYELFSSVEALPLGSAARSERLVVVRDLRNGRVLHKAPTGTLLHPEPHVVGVGPTVGIAVKSDGAVAWIAEDTGEAPPSLTAYDVHALDKTGSRLLASGVDVDPSSLALGGSTLYWMQGGKPLSAVLH
jgi:hypothetical protein